ncbi:NAD(P)H-hydrate dehydratase [Leucobacter sp. CSA1]|uniref:ADP-dependent (S)-NAD(P)H-hydrate dehydratase n=1 Tax=Leucobacter chromiisoli TaxID=2796471 RepID=A0A934Q9Q4_9MICO|nr:ADP/ATP-dependent (S)-NAD(P)H-hydrate dehydratase [Leucobacter chromiisoli]MBK0420118.1 NAD(P)H-hydrate dehydratase [Leucobacter chromiisoli]
MTAQPGRRARRAAGPAEGALDPARAPAQQHWYAEHAAAWIPAPSPVSDKYRRGVLGVRTGSVAYPGAAVLGVSAAWRTGLGMLRYVPSRDASVDRFGLPSPAAAVLAAHPETVFGEGSGPSGGCDAWLIGSGTDPEARSDEEREALLALLAGPAPVVVDAGALQLALGAAPGGASDGAPAAAGETAPSGETERSDAPARLGAPAILTPHRGEFLRLWRAAGLGERPRGWPARGRGGSDRPPRIDALASAASRLAECLGVAVLLKGSTTVTATPGGQTMLSGPATPWLATAGTGDVLAGILGALIAANAAVVREDPEVLGAIGASAAVLHDAAARRASGDAAPGEAESPRGGPITAADVAAALPAAIAELRAARAAGRRHHH